MRSTTFVFSGSLAELREEQKKMIEESEKKRLEKMALWFSKNQSIQEAREAVYNNN